MVRHKKFNINHSIKVRLTKFGKELHKKEWEDFWISVGRLHQFPYTPPKEDENGYVEFQLWGLVKHFGPYCGLGQEPPFETVILIDEGDLKDD